MGERAMLEAVAEYIVNCAWQIPLLAAGAWLLVKAVRPGVLAQHWLWLSVLAMAVVLPLRGTEPQLAGRSVSATAEAGPAAAMLEPGRVAREIPMRREVFRAEGARPVASGAKERVPLPFAGRSLVLSAAATQWLAGIYVMTIFLGGVRLARGLLAARRLVRRSREAVLRPETMRVLEEACRSLRVAMPRMRESGESDGPVIVRALRPVMVLPRGFEEHAEPEVRAALLHELAHVRRRDYLVNLVCQFAVLPVVWHPAVHGIQQRIRRTREMLCDAIAAEQMGSGAAYASCLVSLARQMVNQADGRAAQAMGLFGNSTMEERVMHLTGTQDGTKAVTSGRVRVLRGLCGCAAMVVAAVVAAAFHVRPAFAAKPAAGAAVAGVQAAARGDSAGQTHEAAAPAPATSAAMVPAQAQAQAAQAKPSGAVPAAGTGVSTPPDEDEPTAVAGEGSYVHRWVAADGKKYVIVNHDPKEPSQEERLREERKLKDAQKDLDDMRLDGAAMDSQRHDLEKELAALSGSKEQIRDLRRQLAELEKDSQIDLTKSPEWQKQMQEMQRKLNDPAWQKQLAELEKNAQLKMLNSPEWQKQLAELERQDYKFNFDFDFEKQMALANSQLDEAKRNETIAKAMKGNEEQMAKLQREMESGELKAKLDEATKLLEEVKRKMETMQEKH